MQPVNSCCFLVIINHNYDECVNLDREGERNGDGQGQALRDSHHQDGDADDEELDKVLDVDGRALGQPRTLLDDEGVDGEVQHEDDDCDG